MFSPHDVALLESFWTWLKQEDHLTDEVQLYGSAQMDVKGFYDDQAGTPTPRPIVSREHPAGWGRGMERFIDARPEPIPEIPEVAGSFITTEDNPFVGNTLSRKARRHLADLAERKIGQNT